MLDNIGWTPVWETILSQGPVWWIYILMLALLAVRIWMSIAVVVTAPARRGDFVDRFHVLSELTVNLPVILGVMGTLIAVSLAVQDKFAQHAGAQELMQSFAASFAMAVSTTILGGLAHGICFLLSSVDHFLAGTPECEED